MPTFASYIDPINLSSLAGGTELNAGDWNGDGVTDLMWVDSASGTSHWFVRTAGAAPDVLVSVGNGVGESTSIVYTPMSRGAPFHTKSSGSVYPTTDLQSGMFAVSRVDTTNGIGGVLSATYRYAGAKLDMYGRGFLGFQGMTIRDEQTLIETTVTSRQDWPYIGLPSSTVKVLGALELSRTDVTYAADSLGGTRYFVKQAQTAQSSKDLNGSPFPTVTASFTYDVYGNATVVAVGTGDGYTRTTTNTYSNDTVNWLLGRLTGATTTSVTPN